LYDGTCISSTDDDYSLRVQDYDVIRHFFDISDSTFRITDSDLTKKAIPFSRFINSCFLQNSGHVSIVIPDIFQPGKPFSIELYTVSGRRLFSRTFCPDDISHIPFPVSLPPSLSTGIFFVFIRNKITFSVVKHAFI
jgi:hypothetical protein